MKAYKESLGERGKKRLMQTGAWLCGTLVCLPLALSVLLIDSRLDSLLDMARNDLAQRLYEHWGGVGIMVLLLWLFPGVLSLLPGWESTHGFDGVLITEFFLASVGLVAISPGMKGFGGIGSALLLSAAFTLAVLAALVAGPVALGFTFRDTDFGLIVIGPVAGSVAFTLSPLSSNLNNVSGPTGDGIFNSLIFFIAWVLYFLEIGILFLALGFVLFALLNVITEEMDKSVSSGTISPLASLVLTGLLLSHAALVWQVVTAWGLIG